MVLQSELYRPMEEAFRSGSLAMSDQAQRAGEALSHAWGDYPLNWILIVASALVLAFNIPNLYRIFPHIAKSFSRWRWHVTIEASLQLARTRDNIAFCCIIPLCLILSRFHLLQIDRLSWIPEQWNTLTVLGILFAWFLVRTLIYLILETRAANANVFQVARKSERNFFIILTFVLLAVVGVLYAFGAQEHTIQRSLILAAGIIYGVFLLIKAQILNSSCNPLTTFLYLCALEFLPTGLLIAACLCL